MLSKRFPSAVVEDPLKHRWMFAGFLAAVPLSARAVAPPAWPSAGGARAEAALPGLAQGVKKTILPNGLTLLVKSVRSAPVVAVNAWVKVGSVHERDEERGITHFIEHMLFKGTEKMPVGELDRRIKAAGGYNNAHTRYESTDFIDILPADKLDVALETMADALQHSTFDDAELQRERLVVLEELHRAQDNPGFEAWNRLTHLVFRQHPYKYPIIGTKERLQNMQRDLLVQYWKRWYRPQNIVVVIVGDVDAAVATRKASRAFGAWPAGKDKPLRLPQEPPQNALRFEEAGGDIQTTLAVLGVPTCAELDDDSPALDMGLAILGQGLSSRLNQEVRERRKLVHSIAAGQFNGAYPGLAYLWAELEPDQVKPALQAIWREVQRMQVEPVGAAELERQRVRLEHDEAAERMSMEGMAGRLGYFESLGNDYRLVDQVAARMRAVTPADVQRVMRKYFKLEKASIVIYRPKKAAPSGLDAQGWQALLASTQPVAATPSKGEALPGGLWRFRLSSGGVLVVKPVHHTPLVAGQFVFPAGQRAEKAGQAGAFNLIARTLLKGVPGMDAARLAAAMDDLGLALGPQAEADRFSLSFQALASKLGPSLELAGRVLREAELPETELAKEKARVLKDIKDKSDAPDEYAADLFNALFYGPESPYGRPLEGTASTLKSLRRAELLELKQATLRPERLLAVLVGDVEPEAARDLLEAQWGAEAWSVEGKALLLPKSPAPRPGPRRQVKRLKKKQAQVFLGWPAPLPSDPDYSAARLLNSVLGEGMDSRLFTEVRDKRSLCYSVYSAFDRRSEPGAWRIYVGTQPERVKEAEAVCRAVAEGIAKEGITAAELQSAKAYAKGIFQVARQDFANEARILANYEFWGLGAEAVEAVPDKMDAVTLEDCRRVAQKWIKVDQAVVVVVQP
jgi:zinc protease